MEFPITIELVTELATAIAFVGMATLLGYLGAKWMGAIMLGGAAALASILCIAGTFLGYQLRGNPGAWIGLLAGIVLAGILLARILGNIIRGRSGRFVAGLWFGFCALCIFGYLAGGWVGLLTITLPSVAIFWVGLFRISAYILPLRDRSQQREAFRSLLTFTLGTNYPYYFAKDGKPDKRVDGNPYLQFFAGPGIVYTDCDHAAYVTDGVNVKGVFEPGLTFTHLFDLPPKVVDLRPQLRAFPVEALTKDGIPIKVVIFIPFRIDSGGQLVELGRPFPFRKRAVYLAVAGELIERKPNKEESGKRHEWDGQLVPVIATRIVQDIISRYTVDELCAPLDPERDPRVEIATELRKRVKEALLPLGIEAIGGGISNLIPQDSAVMQRRLDSWRTEWQRRILRLMSEGEAERKRQIELARAEAETEIVVRLGRIVEESMRTGGVSQAALALRFVDCLGEIVSESEGQWPLPDGVEETLKRLRGGIEEGQR